MRYLVENKIILDSAEITYIFVPKRIKNIYFRFKDDGKLYVSGPSRTQKNIEKLLLQNKESILKLYQKNALKKEKPITYLGRELSLIITNAKPALYDDVIYAESKDAALNYLYKQSLPYFQKRVDVLKQEFDNLPNFMVRTRLMKTKWGVCNIRNNNITLNSELYKYDITCLDYVIVHELSHFIYPNHSKNFWLQVSKYYPKYKDARKMLKE